MPRTTHAHPMVSKADIADLNERYAPFQIEKVWERHAKPIPSYFVTQARNTETGEVIYRCEGWSKASRGQALNAIIERRA